MILQLNYQNGLSGPIPNVFQKADFINQLIKILKHNQLFVEKFQDAFSLEKSKIINDIQELGKQTSVHDSTL